MKALAILNGWAHKVPKASHAHYQREIAALEERLRRAKSRVSSPRRH